MKIARFFLKGLVTHTNPEFFVVMFDILAEASLESEVCILDLSEASDIESNAAFLMAAYLKARGCRRKTAFHTLIAGASSEMASTLNEAAKSLDVALQYLHARDLVIYWPGNQLDVEKRIYKKLLELGEASASELAKAMGKERSRSAISAKLIALKTLGLVDVRSIKPKAGGRPTVKYRVFRLPDELVN